MAFQVQSKACSTCIYGKRSASRATPAQLEAEVADPNVKGFFTGFRVCHHSETACCAGFWKRHRNDFAAGQIAQRLNMIEFVEHKMIKNETLNPHGLCVKSAWLMRG